MKIEFSNEEIGILVALVFDSLNNKEAERWFEGMDEKDKEKAKRAFFRIKSKVLASSFMGLADNIIAREEGRFE